MQDLRNKYAHYVEWYEDEKKYISRVLELPGLTAFGKTRVDAVKETLTVIEALDCGEKPYSFFTAVQ